jgi:hypothetical protein
MPLYISDYDENGIDRNAPDSPIAHEDGKAQYHYDSKGEYTTTGKTQFIRGVHLASAMATMIAPPNAATGKARMFDQTTKTWSYKTDNRGTVVYDKSTKQESVVDYLGDIKDTHTTIKPPSTRHKHVGGNWIYSDSDRLRHIQNDLMSAIDEVHINAIYQALGFKGTPMQLERYNDKYQQAKDGKFSPDENTSIITKHELYISEIRKTMDMIESFRSSVEESLDSKQFDKAEDEIKVFKVRFLSSN